MIARIPTTPTVSASVATLMVRRSMARVALTFRAQQHCLLLNGIRQRNS